MKTLSAIILSVLFGALVFAQSDVAETESAELITPNVAIKVDDFGNLGECHLSAVLDNFLTQLQNNPSATGYIISYQGKDVLPARYASNSNLKRIANYIKFRNFDESQFVSIDGGFRDEVSNELWLVPPGAQPPVATETIAQPELPTDKSFLYDTSYLITEYSGDNLGEYVLSSVIVRETEEARFAEEEYRRENPAAEDTQPPIEEPSEIEESAGAVEERTQEELDEIKFAWTSEKFGEIMKTLENSQGIIIFYADDTRYDTGKLKIFMEQGRNRIAEKAEISTDQIQIIFGGYRGQVQAEFHIVPENAEFPISTPEERPVDEIEK